MQRRTFMSLTGGALMTGLLGCASGATSQRHRAVSAELPAMDAAGFHASRRFVSTRAGQIAYVERGTGEAALFLHGFPLNSFQWRDALVQLSPYRRCIAPDFLGLGYTEVAEGQSVAPEAQVQMLIEFLDALAITTVDLIANDSGAAVAQLLIVNQPARVRSFLLTNGDTEFDSPPPALLPVIELAKQGQFVDQWLVPWLADPVRARSAQGIGGMCYANPEHPSDEAIACYLTPLQSTPRRKALTHAYAVAFKRNALAGIEPALRRCKVPTRILWGMADDIFAASNPDYLNQVFGNSQGVRRLADAKLFWPEEQPDVIVEEALKLWQQA